MTKVLETWTVQPHGLITEITEGVLTVEGEIVMPLGRFPRRMTAVRLAGDRVAIWSAIALDEPGMRRIEALGRPSILIVPSDAHRLDAKIWRQRYPHMAILTPPGAAEAVAEIVPVDATHDMLGDFAVRFVTVPGTAEHEAALIVSRDDGLTLILNDVLANVGHPHGIGARIMGRLFGFGTAEPQVPRPLLARTIEDKGLLAQQFRAWADEPRLTRIVPSHGDIIADDPAGVLRTLAATLDD